MGSILSHFSHIRLLCRANTEIKQTNPFRFKLFSKYERKIICHLIPVQICHHLDTKYLVICFPVQNFFFFFKYHFYDYYLCCIIIIFNSHVSKWTYRHRSHKTENCHHFLSYPPLRPPFITPKTKGLLYHHVVNYETFEIICLNHIHKMNDINAAKTCEI